MPRASGTCHGVHGFACGRDDLAISGSLEAWEFVAFWLRDRRVQAAMAVNTRERMTDVGNLIRLEHPTPARGA
jgi:hypothetical protein